MSTIAMVVRSSSNNQISSIVLIMATLMHLHSPVTTTSLNTDTGLNGLNVKSHLINLNRNPNLEDQTETEDRDYELILSRYDSIKPLELYPRIREIAKRMGSEFLGKRMGSEFLGKRFGSEFLGKRVGSEFLGKRMGSEFLGKRMGSEFLGK